MDYSITQTLNHLGLKKADALRKIDPNILQINKPVRLVVYSEILGYDEPIPEKSIYEWHILKTQDTTGNIIFKQRFITFDDYNDAPRDYNDVPRLHKFSLEELENVSTYKKNPLDYNNKISTITYGGSNHFEYWVLPFDDDISQFLTGEKRYTSNHKINDYNQAVQSLTRENQHIKHPALASEVWAQINGQVKSSGGWYDKFSKGFKFKSEQAAIHFLELMQPQPQKDLPKTQAQNEVENNLQYKIQNLYKRAQARQYKIQNL